MAPNDIEAGPITFFIFNFAGSVAFFCIITIDLTAIMAPTTNINGKNTGHIASDTFVIKCSTCNNISCISALLF